METWVSWGPFQFGGPKISPRHFPIQSPQKEYEKRIINIVQGNPLLNPQGFNVKRQQAARARPTLSRTRQRIHQINIPCVLKIPL